MGQAAHYESNKITNPGSLPKSLPSVQRLRMLFIAFIVIGVIGLAVGLSQDGFRERIWASFLINHFYFLSLALGGLFFAAIQWLTGAMWSAPLRRVAESFTSYLPVVALTFLGVVLGVKAKIETIFGFSAHKDSDHLVDFVQSAGDRLKKVFVVMGELKASMFLAQRIRDQLGIQSFTPTIGERVEL